MKNMNKKGQGAMEYLMTYGWAILVVLIVGIVLWQLGIFNLGGTAKTFLGFGAVKPMSWAIPGGTPATSEGVATMLNGEGSRISPGGCNLTFIGGTGLFCNCTVSTDSVAAGSEFRLNFTNCTGGTSGTPYDVTLQVNYTKAIGRVTEQHTTTGTLKGPFE